MAGGSGGEYPSVGAVGESEVDESAQVDGGGSEAQSDAVAFDASVADPSVSVGDEPGDGSFDHGPVLAVVVQVLSVAPPSTGGGENLVVFTDPVGFAVDCGGAADPQRAAPTLGTERGRPGGGDRYRDLVGQVTVPAW